MGSKYTDADRARVVSLMATGMSARKAAQEVGCAPNTAYKWMNEFVQSEGFAGILRARVDKCWELFLREADNNPDAMAHLKDVLLHTTPQAQPMANETQGEAVLELLLGLRDDDAI